MRTPSVTVIIPALNGEQTLGPCLRAVLEQRYGGRIETVVINDGSTDATSSLAKSFPGVVVLDQQNRGRSAARNRGAAESSGEIIAFTDADCLPRKEWVEKLVARLLMLEKGGIVGGAMVLPKNANLWQRIDHQAWAHSTGPEAPAGPSLLASTANMCMFRNVFKEAGGFDERFSGSEDSDLALRVHRAGHRNYFEPAAVVEHHHPRTTFRAFFRQRYNYGKWTIQTVLRHRPLTPYSWMFPNNRALLALFWPGYALLATGFTVLRAWRSDVSVLWLSPLHLMGRLVEYLGTVAGCAEYQRKFAGNGRAQ
jgi:glycosyltransferase involved in cell wall biosynthesis